MQVIDVFFPKQKNSQASTEMTDYQEIFDFIMTQPDDQIQEWCLWLHSHNTMKTFWSWVDTTQMKSFWTDWYCKHMFHIVTSTNTTDNDVVLGMSFLWALTMHAWPETFLYTVPVEYFDDVWTDWYIQEWIDAYNAEIDEKNQKIIDAIQPIDPETLAYFTENAQDIVTQSSPKLHQHIETLSEKDLLSIAYDVRKEWIDSKTSQLLEKDIKVVYNWYNYWWRNWWDPYRQNTKSSKKKNNQQWGIFSGKANGWGDDDDDDEYYPYGGRVQPRNPTPPAKKEDEDEWYTQHHWRVNNSWVVQQYSVSLVTWITMDYDWEEVMAIHPTTKEKVDPKDVWIFTYN